MNNGGDAAEQVVRLSLEGVEVAAKITGEAAKNIGIMLLSALKEEQKTKGKSRLSKMIRSGKELKVFSIEQKDLKKFTQEAKRYGVLYNVLRDKSRKSDEHATVDIIARAEDASKIQRIFERFELSKVDKASIINQIEKEISDKNAKSVDKPKEPEKSKAKSVLEAALSSPAQKEGVSQENPSSALTEKNPQSEPSSKTTEQVIDKDSVTPDKKPSVRKQLEELKADSKDMQGKTRSDRSKENTKPHKKPKGKNIIKKMKER